MAHGAAPLKPTALLKKIAAAGQQFGFFEAARILEAVLGSEIGPSDSPDVERVNFSHSLSLGYPTSDVIEITSGEGVDVTLSFLGLLGHASPLAPEWTDNVLLDDDEGALQAFYDVFHHRAATYLFAAWRRLTAEGSLDLRGADVSSKRMRSLAGIDAWAEDDGNDPLPPMVALGLSDFQRGHAQTIDRESTERLLERLFPGWGIRAEVGIKRFVSFTPREWAKVGSSRAKLGMMVYGDGRDDEAGLLRIHVGPVDASRYEALMPGGTDYVALERAAARIVGNTVDLELEVHLHRDDAPTTRLGQRLGARLGVDARYGNPRNETLSVRVPLGQNGVETPRTFVFSPEDM
jgi:type VI secretion system protein ImpH